MRPWADLGPLSGATFRRLWVGSTFSAIGEQFAAFAVIYYVWDLTRSPTAVGTVGLAIGIPIVAFALVGGSLADSMDRRRLALITTAGQIFVSFTIVTLLVADALSLWAVFVLVAARSALAASGAPARKAFVPRLLPRNQVGAGLALFNLSFQAAMLTGPVAAGAVTAWAGVTTCFLINGLLYIAALYGIVGLPITIPEPAPSRPGILGVAHAARFVVRTPALAGALLCDLLATALAMPIALFPVLNDERFGGAPQTLGLLLTALGAGGIAASMVSGLVTRSRRPGRALLAAATVWSVALAGVGLTHHVIVALALLAIAGGADMMAVTARGTIVQLLTPDSYRGRVSALEHIISAAVPHLGNVRAGLMASWFSGGVALIAGGLMSAIAIGALATFGPSLRRFDAAARGVGSSEFRQPTDSTAGVHPDGGRFATGRRK